MTRTHYKFAALIVLVLLTMPLRAQNGIAGQISAMKGKVTLLRDQAAPVLLHQHDQVHSGDSIVTDANSSATIRLPDGSSLRIFPNSHIEMRSEAGSWKEFLHVLFGNVRVQIERLSGRPNPKAVTTPTAIIAVRGTIFAVEVEQNGDTKVGLEKGLVAVTSALHPDQEVVLKPGQEVWVRQGQNPTQPHRMQRAMPGLSGPGTSGVGTRGAGVGGPSRAVGTGRRGPQM